MKKAHIIAHSHWDREWYLPYEKHHMILVEFMDKLLKTIKEDQEFKSFHLDGQTIMLDDYLQVRPHKREEIIKYVKEGRIIIGPWYILQDEWLTCSESNVRNMQVGLHDAREFGNWCPIGYFPDSFGNLGQAPQILKESGIDTAVFGRGVKPTGFNNEVTDGCEFESQFSEMHWESPDGSRVLGILFANWYSNGIEIPVDKKEAKEYWDKKLADAGKFASTDHLLFMNGCDHQPVQTDLTKARKTAKKLFPDIEFVHSDFQQYVKDIKDNLPEDLAVIYGELRSQRTDGFYTLAGTASSRIYLKQMNQRCEMLFTKVAEPLASMAFTKGMEYPHDLFLYGWKTLMQCHPHDSICGCSVDEVHREMVTRFEKAEQVALHIIDEAMKYLTSKIDTKVFTDLNKEALPFLAVNPAGYEKSGVIEVMVPIHKYYFSQAGMPASVKAAKEMDKKDYKIVDELGKVIPGTVTIMEPTFGYDLPKDRFRQPYMTRMAKVVMEVSELPPFSYESFALIEGKTSDKTSTQFTDDHVMENKYLNVKINENGSITVTEKAGKQTYSEIGILEDCSDLGNEYVYGRPVNEVPILSDKVKAEILVLEDKPYRSVVEVKFTLMIPKSAQDTLEQEINDMVEYKDRQSKRTKELEPLHVVTTYTLERESRAVKVKTTFDSQAMDHRIRVLFPTQIDTQYHYADSIFEVVKRNNVPEKEWENPCNAAHQQAFVDVHNENAGLVIANKGLNEYEVLRDSKNTIALTIHRGVRELGDWGVFMTPEAQCLGEHTVEYAIIPHVSGEDTYKAYVTAYDFQREIPVQPILEQTTMGIMRASDSLFSCIKENEGTIWSSLKVNETTNNLTARYFNVSGKESELIMKGFDHCYRTNLLEEEQIEEIGNKIAVKPYQIITIGLKE